MKTIIMIMALAFAAMAQTGTVVITTTSNVVGTSGTMVCTLTNTTPVLPTGVHIACLNGGVAVLAMDSVIPVGPNGAVGSLTLGTNSVIWSVVQPIAGPYLWQMSANGVSKSGSF